MKQIPVSRSKNIIVQKTGKEVLLYDLETHKAVCLNETAAFVWENCDGKNSVSEIAGKMAVKFGAGADETLAWLAIDTLGKANILEPSEAENILPAGFSRREAIKKAGLASMIALPLVSAIIAPHSTQAQSTDCVFRPCTFDNHTQSDCCDSRHRCFFNVTPTCNFCVPTGVGFAACGLGNLADCKIFCENSASTPGAPINMCCNTGTPTVVPDGSLFICQCP